MRLDVFAQFQVVGELVAGGDMSRVAQVRWSSRGAQKQDVYFLSHDRKKEQDHAG